MTEFERLTIKMFAANAKLATMMYQQNNAQVAATTSSLVALKVMMSETGTTNDFIEPVNEMISVLTDFAKASNKNISSVYDDLKQINQMIESLGGDPLDLDNIKKRQN